MSSFRQEIADLMGLWQGILAEEMWKQFQSIILKPVFITDIRYLAG